MKAEDKRGGEIHVLIFPYPAQGHVNPTLQLAELLALSDIHVTFLNTEHIHHRLLHFSDIQARLASYSTLQFKTISDGLPADHPRHGHQVMDIIKSLKLHAKPLLRDICLESTSGKPRFTCIIEDGIFGGLTADLGDELGIPIVHFRAPSACCFMADFAAPRLFECNELPIRGEEDMDRIIKNIPGMENLIRCRDLPSFFRPSQGIDLPMEYVIYETQQTLKAQAVIFNTFEDLEGPVLSQMRLHFPEVFTFGPLHAHLNFRRASKTASSNSLWEVNMACMVWLDAQTPKSVIYVSFGSITMMTREQLTEILYGLVNSKKRFLWVMRPDMLTGKDGNDLPEELVEGIKDRGFMVGWAPQTEILEHRAIGGFVTHSGWNSVLESIVAGVPMICWPFCADHQIISRYVSEVWKVGLDMKDVCDRKIVEKMVKDVMVERKEEFLKATEEMAALAKRSVSEGGSSYCNLGRFIEYLKSLGRGKKSF